MPTQLEAAALTTFDVSSDGEAVRFNVRDSAGEESTLVLPTACVNQLLMTLPRIIESALRKTRHDDSLRLAHPMERFSIELGERNGAGEARYILTLHTGREFHVSFAASRDLLSSLAFCIAEDVLEQSADRAQMELSS